MQHAGQFAGEEAPGQTFEHFYFSLQAAVAGLGVAIGPYRQVCDDIEAGLLVAPLGFCPDGTGYHLLAPPRPLPAAPTPDCRSGCNPSPDGSDRSQLHRAVDLRLGQCSLKVAQRQRTAKQVALQVVDAFAFQVVGLLARLHPSATSARPSRVPRSITLSTMCSDRDSVPILPIND